MERKIRRRGAVLQVYCNMILLFMKKLKTKNETVSNLKKILFFLIIPLIAAIQFATFAPTAQSEAQLEIPLNPVEREQLEYFKTHSSEINRLLAEFSIREIDITCQPDSGFGAELPGRCTAIKVKAKLGYTGTLTDYFIDFEAFAQSLGKKKIDFNDIDADTILHIIRDAETQAFVRDYISQNKIQNAQVSSRKPESWEQTPFAIIYEVRYANTQNHLILRYGDQKLIEYSTDLSLRSDFQFPHREKLVTSQLFNALALVADRPIPSDIRCGTGPLKLYVCTSQVEEVVSYDYCQIYIKLGASGRLQNYFILFDHNKIVPEFASFEIIEKIKDKTYLTRILNDSFVRSYMQKYPDGGLQTRPKTTYEKDKLFLYAESGLGVWSERGTDNDLALKLNCANTDKSQTIQKVTSTSESIIAWRDEIIPWVLLILYAIFVPLVTGWLFHRRFVLLWQWLVTWGIFGIASFVIGFIYNTWGFSEGILLSIITGLAYSISIVLFGFISSIIGTRIKALRFIQEVLNSLTRRERITLVLILYGTAIVPALVAGKLFFLFTIWFILPQIAILLGLQCVAIIIIILSARHFFAVAKQREPKSLVFHKKDYIVYALIFVIAVFIFLYIITSYLGRRTY